MRAPQLGIFRGEVAQNIDPEQRGRVQVKVPAVLGSGQLAWALPCSPGAGDDVGMFWIPPVGAKVWVAFENGDIDRPLVLGGFWERDKAPSSNGLPMVTVLKTDGITITLDATPGGGGLTIEVGSPAVSQTITLAASSTGLSLSMGQSTIELNGVSVKVNGGALEVM